MMSTAVLSPPAVRDVPEIEAPRESAAPATPVPPPKPDWSKQHKIASYLDWLTRGKLDVRFDPEGYLDRDRFHPQCPSKGHLYTAELNSDRFDDWFSYWLDDREERPLEVQLLNVVRCMAKRFEKIADTIEARLAHIKADDGAGKAGAA